MFKRLVGFVCLGLVACFMVCAPRDAGSAGMYSIATNHFFAFVDTSTGYHYTNANSGKVLAYEADIADTTGQGTAGTFFATSADTGWYWGNLASNVYDFAFQDDTDTLFVAQNIVVYGRTLGDTCITDSMSFNDDVVGTHAITDKAIRTAHLDGNAVTAAKLADQSVDSAAVQTAAVHPVHMDTVDDYTFGLVRADSGLVVLDSIKVDAVRWDNGSGKIDGEQIADDTIDDDSIDLTDVTLADFTDDINNTVDTEWDTWAEHPTMVGSGRILVGDALAEPVAVAMSGDVAIVAGGATTIQDNAIDAEDLSSTDNPDTGDYLSWNTSDTFTWQTAEERNMHIFSDVDTSMTFETTDPGAAALWLVYKAGVLVGDVAVLFYIGTPGYYDNLGEKYTFDFGCTCRVNDTLDCFKSPAVAKTAGSARLGGIIERWPWNGPNDPK